jgi:hypothetical protein
VLFPAGQLVPFILVTVLFCLWGIPSNLNDVLIRHFMKSFAINRLQAGLVQFAFYMGYFFLAMPAALLMKKAGYKIGFVAGLVPVRKRMLSILAGRAGRELRVLSVRFSAALAKLFGSSNYRNNLCVITLSSDFSPWILPLSLPCQRLRGVA